MDDLQEQLLGALETHSVEQMRAVLDGGLDVRQPIRGKLPLAWLTEMYTRSDRFPACLRLLLDHGASLADPVLESVLLDDAERLGASLRDKPDLTGHRVSMVSAFTPLEGATLLHAAAEFGNVDAAGMLIKAGADVDATADVDRHGLNGHTPLFHTVNSPHNVAEPILRLLLQAGARPDVRVAGITWGRGFEWETTIFDVTPISYAQFGLLPQMHRDERDIDGNVRLLLEAAGRPMPPMENVPNRYVRRG